ncbi:hypothetical protein [Lacrimispora sp.]|uniref:hypothetical protein n=1 Tax=Lacrimispora sp. TaxID=2719234 RepID=UPI00289EC75C|nr:hypothetical protein [Lacrimispora sp.]
MRIYKGIVYFLSMIGLVALLTYFIFALVLFNKELETGRIIRIGRRVYGVVAREL